MGLPAWEVGFLYSIWYLITNDGMFQLVPFAAEHAPHHGHAEDGDIFTLILIPPLWEYKPLLKALEADARLTHYEYTWHGVQDIVISRHSSS